MKKIRMTSLGDLIEPATPIRCGDRDFPILSMTMSSGLIDQSDKFKKRVASENTADYKVVTRNQLVVGFPIDEGVLAFQKLYDAAIVSPAYNIWNVKPSCEIDVDYLERYLRSTKALAYYKAKLRGSTARRRSLPTDIFLDLPILLPPKREQTRIVTILDKADAILQKRHQTIQLADEFLRAVFLDMFGDPARNPKRWPLGTIRDVASEVKYGSSDKAGAEGKYPMLRMNNITYSGGWDFTDLKYINLTKNDEGKYLVRKGDLLFNRTNSKELVGKTAVYREKSPMAYAGYLIRVRTNELANPEYIAAYLNSSHGKTTLQNMCKSIVGMANINAQEMQDIKIALPPKRLQDRYASFVHATLRHQARHLTAQEAARELYASLTQRAFQGAL